VSFCLLFAVPPPDADLKRMLVFNGMVPREVHQAVMQISIEGLDEAFAKPSRMLVTFGVRDALLRVLDLNPSVQLSIYPEAGHAPFYKQPRRFNAELAAFASS